AAMPPKEQFLDPNAARVYIRIAGPANNKEGACGWAARIERGQGEEMTQETFYGGHRKMSVNHFLLYAVLELLKLLPPDEALQVFTNNAYLYDGITNWVNGWRESNWK